MVAARPGSEGWAARLLVAGSIVVLVAVDVAYLAIIRSQGGPPPDNAATVPFVAGYMLAMAALLVASLVDRPWLAALRPALRAAASAGLLALGILAIFSIGLPVLVAGAFATASTVMSIVAMPRPATVIATAVGALLSLALLLGGLEVSWNVIICPATGQSGGTTAGFFGRGSSYECNNGQLTITSS